MLTRTKGKRKKEKVREGKSRTSATLKRCALRIRIILYVTKHWTMTEVVPVWPWLVRHPKPSLNRMAWSAWGGGCNVHMVNII